MALPTGSSGQSWKTFAPPPSVGAGAVSLPLPIEHKILYEAPIGFYISCLGNFVGNAATFGSSSFTIARKGSPDIQQVSWSLSSTVAPGVFDSIFFVITDQLFFALGDGDFHFAFVEGYADPRQVSGSRKGLLIESLSAQPNETVAESPHMSLEPTSFQSDIKLQGDLYYVLAGVPVKAGLKIIDVGAFGQLYTGSFLSVRPTESLNQLINRFTSSDIPTSSLLGLNALVVDNTFITVNTPSHSGSLIRNATWGGGFFMPDSDTVAVFGEDKDFLVANGSVTSLTGLEILSGTLNVFSGSIYIRGDVVRLEISGLSASAHIIGQRWAAVTVSNVPIDKIAGTPGLPDGVLYLTPSASTSDLEEAHIRVSGTWVPIISHSFDTLDGGFFDGS
ncbi:hypothetical protein LCGC14_1113410 [marine sediment metagenome]|uniref:Uncharacterized protein n=1 Tax=marine sediment metagenome TaxID=412755 RepID=A0A0F9M644_9ZZZZ